MIENNNGISIKYVLTMIGAILSYSIGAAYASGQETMQLYSIHGTSSVVASLCMDYSLAILGIIIMLGCKKLNITTGREFFAKYLGKYVGAALYYYTVAYVFCTLIGQISGGGSFVNQYYGLPYFAGACILALLCIISAILGLQKLVDVVSKIAPFLVVIIIASGIIALANPIDGFESGNLLAAASDGAKISDDLVSTTVVNHCYNIIFYIPFFVTLYGYKPKGRECASTKELVISCVGAFTITATISLINILSQVANFSIVDGTSSPSLALVDEFIPFLAPIFVIILFLACFTTASPVAVMAANYFAQKGSAKYAIVCCAVVLIAFGISFLGSYAEIVNILINVSGKVGIFVYIWAAIYAIYKKVRKNNVVDEA